MLERRKDDYWNIDGASDPSDSWTGFHTIHIIGRKTSRGVNMVQRLTKKQTASRPNYLCSEIWKNMSEAAQRKEKQKWATEKPKLDSARRLRGIYFIDPADEEFRETVKKTRGQSWKFRCQQQCFARSREERTGKLVTFLMLARQNTHALLKPTNLRESVWKELCTNIMKTILQERGINSLSHCNLVHNFTPMPKATTIA